MVFSVVFESISPETILREQLDRLKIEYKFLQSGEVEIQEELSISRFSEFEVSLNRYSIEILNDEKSQLVQRIKNILLELIHDDKNLSVTLSSHLSNQLNLSYGYISYIFSQYTYSSIENYLIMLKVERAKRLIMEDVMSLKEVSSVLRYSSVGHFSRQFKKTTGITISVFKKIISNKRRSNRFVVNT